MLQFTRNRHGDWVLIGKADELLGPGVARVRTRKGYRHVKVTSVGRAFYKDGVRMRYGYLSTTGHVADHSPAPSPVLAGRPGG